MTSTVVVVVVAGCGCHRVRNSSSQQLLVHVHAYRARYTAHMHRIAIVCCRIHAGCGVACYSPEVSLTRGVAPGLLAEGTTTPVRACRRCYDDAASDIARAEGELLDALLAAGDLAVSQARGLLTSQP